MTWLGLKFRHVKRLFLVLVSSCFAQVPYDLRHRNRKWWLEVHVSHVPYSLNMWRWVVKLHWKLSKVIDCFSNPCCWHLLTSIWKGALEQEFMTSYDSLLRMLSKHPTHNSWWNCIRAFDLVAVVKQAKRFQSALIRDDGNWLGVLQWGMLPTPISSFHAFHLLCLYHTILALGIFSMIVYKSVTPHRQQVDHKNFNVNL